MSRIVTFRGLMADGAQERISLETIRGEKGYKINKLQLISQSPGVLDTELVFKVYSKEQTTITSTIDFSKTTLLGIVYFSNGDSRVEPPASTIIFDNMIFNQDIFITLKDAGANAAPANYYIELEQMDLALDEATVATLKDIRNND